MSQGEVTLHLLNHLEPPQPIAFGASVSVMQGHCMYFIISNDLIGAVVG